MPDTYASHLNILSAKKWRISLGGSWISPRVKYIEWAETRLAWVESNRRKMIFFLIAVLKFLLLLVKSHFKSTGYLFEPPNIIVSYYFLSQKDLLFKYNISFILLRQLYIKKRQISF